MSVRRFYACVDPTNPEAAGVCDRGGEVRRYADLRQEMMWAGERLVWNGFLVCDQHRDKPNEQQRAQVLWPDPVPVVNPRPLRALTPLPGLIVDHVVDPTQTNGVVWDSYGRPVFDSSGQYPAAEHFPE